MLPDLISAALQAGRNNIHEVNLFMQQSFQRYPFTEPSIHFK
jgi:hypothetical protein